MSVYPMFGVSYFCVPISMLLYKWGGTIPSNPSHPLIAFEHLSLYIQKHLSIQKHSMVICGSLWHY